VASDPDEKRPAGAGRRVRPAAAKGEPAAEGARVSGLERAGLDYKSAGVDQDRKDKAVEEALGAATKTFRTGVIPNPGGFAGLFALGRYTNPVLVACTDGVGTKLKLATLLGRHDTVGIDLVAMSVNDLIVQGADPLFFLDYIAMGRVEPEVVKALLAGICEGCRIAGCALLGGETAEMPGMYAADDYDLAGFAVGAVERDRVIDGAQVVPGDTLIGVESSGVHSNGYSLVRKIFVEHAVMPLEARPAALRGRTLGEALLEPTRIYAQAVRGLLDRFSARDEVKAMAHITGAGIPGNLPRVLPAGVGARVRKGSWPVPPVFEAIREAGGVAEKEMYDVFNMGLGMIVVVPPAIAPAVIAELARFGLGAHVVGETTAGAGEVELAAAAS
jgi:phosphoribosylformylglycinamidine cyclo-ligase